MNFSWSWWYKLVRFSGYTAGGGGLVLVYSARMAEGANQILLFKAGFGALIFMFLTFLLSYGLYLARFFRR